MFDHISLETVMGSLNFIPKLEEQTYQDQCIFTYSFSKNILKFNVQYRYQLNDTGEVLLPIDIMTSEFISS